MNKLKRIKQEKGITLVVLIITIIVLLILAVVAIRAVQGDGIISYAKNARDEYRRAQANEAKQLQEYMNYLNGENFTGGTDSSEIDLLEKYVLGADKTGRDINEIMDWETNTFINEESTIADASVSMIYLEEGTNPNDGNPKYNCYFKYNKKAYKIVWVYNESTDIVITEDVKEIYTPEGREGTTVKYDSDGDGIKEDWIIITDRNGKVEIVSANVMTDAEGNTLTLGSRDASVIVTKDLDGNGTVGDDGDKAIASYNNAITRINNFCKDLVKATDNEGVRSVGASSDTAGYYSSSNFNLWFKGTESVKAGDEYYEEDLVKMSYFNIAITEKAYWLASREVREDLEDIAFVVLVRGDNSSGHDVWAVLTNGTVFKQRA